MVPNMGMTLPGMGMHSDGSAMLPNMGMMVPGVGMYPLMPGVPVGMWEPERRYKVSIGELPTDVTDVSIASLYNSTSVHR